MRIINTGIDSPKFIHLLEKPGIMAFYVIIFNHPIDRILILRYNINIVINNVMI